MNDPEDEISSGTAGLCNDWQKTAKLRAQLVQTARQWEECCGVAPQITNAIAELDAARLVGMTEEKYCADGRKRTAVSGDFDFIHKCLRYEVTGSRPSGKEGSKVSKVSNKLKKDCDLIVWVLYDQCYAMEEAWEFDAENYKRMFANVAHLWPPHMRLGHRLYPPRDALLARGKPIVIDPREVVKIAKHYGTELAIAGDDRQSRLRRGLRRPEPHDPALQSPFRPNAGPLRRFGAWRGPRKTVSRCPVASWDGSSGR
jgi:hypothetical protein